VRPLRSTRISDEHERRMLWLLDKMSLERTGWRGFLRRWYYSAEPLRHDAARLLDEIGSEYPRPYHTRRVSASPETDE
jgi:hypothetical protein